MKRIEAIIRFKQGKWDSPISEKEIATALCDHFERTFDCGAMQEIESIGDEPVLCPHGDCIRSQVTCVSFNMSTETGWCSNWDDETGFCSDEDILAIFND